MVSKKIALVFGGQGSLCKRTCLNFYQNYSEFRYVFETASEIVGYDISDIYLNAPIDIMNSSTYSQICTLTIELGFLQIFKERGAPFDAVSGFSLGEYAALVAANIIDMKTAIELVNVRTRVMNDSISDNMGKMIAVMNLNIEDIEKICEIYGYDSVAISNYNSFNQVVVSVSGKILDEFIKTIKSQKGKVYVLNIDRPFHHIMMKPMADLFKSYLITTKFNKPTIPIYMNATGRMYLENDSFQELLYKQIFKPVQWIKIVQNMKNDHINTFYELSPKPVLSSFIRNIIGSNADINCIQDFSNKI